MRSDLYTQRIYLHIEDMYIRYLSILDIYTQKTYLHIGYIYNNITLGMMLSVPFMIAGICIMFYAIRTDGKNWIKINQRNK